MVALATQSKAHLRADRGDDLYQTPPEATLALLKLEKLPYLIWEPACGRGAIMRVLVQQGHRVLGTDIKPRCAGGRKADFLALASPPNAAVYGIVTNPPYQLAARFAARAIEIGCQHICMLMRLGFLEAGNPRSEAGRARIFCLDHQPPARVYVFRNRLPMMHRDGWKGRRATSAMAFAWLVWDAAHEGPTELHRISWEAMA